MALKIAPMSATSLRSRKTDSAAKYPPNVTLTPASEGKGFVACPFGSYKVFVSNEIGVGAATVAAGIALDPAFSVFFFVALISACTALSCFWSNSTCRSKRSILSASDCGCASAGLVVSSQTATSAQPTQRSSTTMVGLVRNESNYALLGHGRLRGTRLSLVGVWISSDCCA